MRKKKDNQWQYLHKKVARNLEGIRGRRNRKGKFDDLKGKNHENEFCGPSRTFTLAHFPPGPNQLHF